MIYKCAACGTTEPVSGIPAMKECPRCDDRWMYRLPDDQGGEMIGPVGQLEQWRGRG